jgi:hypothetical protein
MDCGWIGQRPQLIAVPLPTNPLSLEINQDKALEILKHMSEQYMKLLYQSASKAIGQSILQSGLVGRSDTKNFTRLLRAACLGAHKATLEEAEAISKEHKEKRQFS